MAHSNWTKDELKRNFICICSSEALLALIKDISFILHIENSSPALDPQNLGLSEVSSEKNILLGNSYLNPADLMLERRYSTTLLFILKWSILILKYYVHETILNTYLSICCWRLSR